MWHQSQALLQIIAICDYCKLIRLLLMMHFKIELFTALQQMHFPKCQYKLYALVVYFKTTKHFLLNNRIWVTSCRKLWCSKSVLPSKSVFGWQMVKIIRIWPNNCHVLYHVKNHFLWEEKSFTLSKRRKSSLFAQYLLLGIY